jgi:transcription antitermination protein NusB
MQSLFALQQCKEANHELCLEKISDDFTADLNSMEVQDKPLLATQKKDAIKIFGKAFAKGETSADHEDKKIKKSVTEALQFYATQVKKDSDFLRKNLVTDVEKLYDFYIAALSLAGVFAEHAEADKKITHDNFLSNIWIKALRSSEALKKDALKLNRHWQGKQDRTKAWFKDVVRQDDGYLSYLDKKKPSTEDQKKFANHVFRKIILGNTVINEYFEEEVLRWAEDKEIIKGLVEKTVKSFDPESGKAIALHTLSLNWDDDKEFIDKLYKQAAHLSDEHKDLIAKNTRNWDVDRLPLTDRVILQMAIAELITFPNIPVKVTINEYIELAKNYSTPKSRQFINGILDVISNELKTAGEVKKSGRGLIDNK